MMSGDVSLIAAFRRVTDTTPGAFLRALDD
ncbi:hypothetical protein ABMA10_10880 [Plantibacter sp. RU18]